MSPDFIQRATVTGHLHFNGATVLPKWTRENVLYGTIPDIISGRVEQRKQLRYVCGFADIVR